MMQPEMTLAKLAAKHPAGIPVMERHGLDYCCGGGKTLASACAEKGLDPAEVLQAVLAQGPSPGLAVERSWEDATMTELADHIEQTHHAFVRDALARLGSVIPRVVAAHGGSDPRLVELAELVRTFEEEMRDHMVREERVLFPWLRRLERKTEIQGGPPWSVRRPISCMMHDHDDAGATMVRMRALTDGYTPPAGACMTYRSMLCTLKELERDTHRHIHLENNILFPAGIRQEEAGDARTPARPEAAVHDLTLG